MTSSKTYGIGILGLGIMGRRMAAHLQEHPRFRVVTGCGAGAAPSNQPGAYLMGRKTSPIDSGFWYRRRLRGHGLITTI